MLIFLVYLIFYCSRSFSQRLISLWLATDPPDRPDSSGAGAVERKIAPAYSASWRIRQGKDLVMQACPAPFIYVPVVSAKG